MSATAVLYPKTPRKFTPLAGSFHRPSAPRQAFASSSSQAAPELPSAEKIKADLDSELKGTFTKITKDIKLGKGSFATAYSVQAEGEQKVLRELDIEGALRSAKVHDLSPERVGGEWLALLLEGEHVVETSHIIAFQKRTNTYHTITKEAFRTYYALRQKAHQGDKAAREDLLTNPLHQALLNGPLTAMRTVAEYYKDTQELFEFIEGSTEPLPPAQIKSIATQLVTAVSKLHKIAGFIHRDIKPQNILFQKPSDSYLHGRVLILDTGLSRILPTKDLLRLSLSGTFPYMAHEVKHSSTYGQKADNHSLFFTLYKLTTRESYSDQEKAFQDEYPLDATMNPENPQHKKMKELLSSSNPSMAEDDLFIDFLLRLGQMDPDKRISSTEALQHPWIVGGSTE